MSAASPISSIIARRNLIGLAILDVVLFLAANITSKNSSHPGTVSNVFFAAFIVGAALLLVLVVIALVRRERPAR